MRKIAFTLAMTACLIAGRANSQDMMDTGGDDDTETATLLAYLGLSAAEGKATIGEGAGQIEGQIIASTLAWGAARKINTLIDMRSVGEEGSVRVVLLVGKEAFELSKYYEAVGAISSIEAQANTFQSNVTAACKAGETRTSSGLKSGDRFFGIMGLIDPVSGSDPTDDDSKKKPKFKVQPSDILGLLRSDSAFSPVSVTLGDQITKSALLATNPKNGEWIVQSEINVPTAGAWMVNRLVRSKTTLSQYLSPACPNGSKLSNDEKKAISASAKSIIAQIDGLASPKDDKPSMLHRARLLGNIVEVKPDPTLTDGSANIDQPELRPVKTFRLTVDKAGGTVVNTSNIATSLGIPGVTIRGGLVASYQLTNPTTGTVEKSGLVICRQPKKLLMSITGRSIDDVEDLPQLCQLIQPGG